MIRDFLQRAAIEISFDVRWSLVAQAVPENEPFLQKMSIFRNRYLWPPDQLEISVSTWTHGVNDASLT